MISSSAGRPATLVVAAAVVAAEGLLALALGGYVAVETVAGKPADLVSSIAVAGFGVLAGAGLLWVAWGLWQVLRWSRGPSVVAQIFALPVAITLIQSGQYGYGVPLVAGAVVALVALLAPPSTQALVGEDGTPDGRSR
ncbi:hypothetical protein [Microbispora sp. ATCC PTA-5024]|uniref:hypothetical protein n=1 Tax=Microbispora sp. ATCC PTA-5024 TaxID=316330 RepID=UPI0003DD2683|nr:hypothetical protein [Microbispora sp. ATCC PTA-5024]ETK32002.1 hypothetical protein MPTA5024_32100 [Microbispora sp. ATCC PTA-5024]